MAEPGPLKPPQQVTINALTHTVLGMDAELRGMSLEDYLHRVIRTGMFVEDQIRAGHQVLVNVDGRLRTLEP